MLIEETDTLFRGKLDFLIFYQPKSSDKKELDFQMKLYDFRHPVFMDMENQIDKLNRFPSNPELQCFLLDHSNKVVAIGNPVTNPRIRELYFGQISGVRHTTAPLTTIQVTPERLELHGMRQGETYSGVMAYY